VLVYPSITNWRIAAGRAITTEDNNKANLVVAIGQTMYRQLFIFGENPIGAFIQVKSGAVCLRLGCLSRHGRQRVAL